MPPLPTEVTNPFLTYNFLIKWDGKRSEPLRRSAGSLAGPPSSRSIAGGRPQSALKDPGTDRL